MRIFVSIPRETEVFNTFLSQEVRDYMAQYAEVVYTPLDRQIKAEELKKYAADCDVLMTGWGHPTISYEDIKDTNIRLIAHTGGSVGSLVDASIYDHGIRVISGNLMYAESVAEGTIAYMLMGLRSLPDYVNSVRNGNWKLGNDYTKGLLDRTVGLIGLGTISTFLVKKMQIFNVKIKMYSEYPIPDELVQNYGVQPVSLNEALQCDIVSLHNAMNERNRNLIGAEQFQLIRDGALFINTARGHIVDEAAMIEALKQNRFKAVLDVYYNEPLEQDSLLRSLPNVYCIPHLAGPTHDRRPVITMRLVDNICLFEKNEPMPLEISKQYFARMTVGG